MRIKSISIEVKTPDGYLRGHVELTRGLNIISAPNGFGKSLMFSAVAWCLGIEATFGVKPGDRKFFGSGVLARVDTPTGELPVERSTATVTLVNEEGAVVELERPIVGEDARCVRVRETLPGRDPKDILLQANIAFSNNNTGLQPYLFDRMRMPPQRTLRADGTETWLYLENLAPFFFVEQTLGWTDVAATQVYRYRLQDVNATAVEYLLGAEGRLSARLEAQSQAASETKLRQEAASIRRDVDETLGREGFAVDLGDRTNIALVAKRWRTLDLKAELLERYNVNFPAERKRVADRLMEVREVISGSRAAALDRGPSMDAAARVSDLKAKRRELANQAAALRMESAGIGETLEVLVARERSAKDLLTFKRDGVGLAAGASCPTCQQEIDPRHFGLESRTTDLAVLQVKAVERDRRVLQSALEANHEQARAVTVQLQAVEETLKAAQRAISSVDAAVTGNREVLAKAAHDLAECEHTLEKLDALESRIGALQDQLRNWVDKAFAWLESRAANEGDSDGLRIKKFETYLAEAIRALGHTGVQAKQQLALDDRYVVTCDDRELRSLGAASDRARLVTAYTTALLRASRQVGGHHPGFLLLDEPKQQNPDDSHGEMIDEFWTHVTEWLGGTDDQVIIATYLRRDVTGRPM